MGRALAQTLKEIEGARVVACADSDEGRARELAEEFGARAFSDYRDLLALDEVDAVVVATPGFLHEEMVVASARAGKHIFCEKPMAFSVASCDRMIAAAEKAGVKLMIGQVLRYIPRFAKIKEIVDSGVLGDPFGISIVRMGGGWGAGNVHWRRRKDMVGGVLFEVSVHELDFMCYIMGDVERVAAFTGRYVLEGIDYEDTAQVLLRFRNGGIGSLVAGISSAIGVYEGKVLCRRGSLFWGGDGIRYKTFEGEEVRVGEEELPTEPGVHRELREFVEAVREDRPVTIPGEEGRRAVEVVEAAYRSAETGREVSLPLEGTCRSPKS